MKRMNFDNNKKIRREAAEKRKEERAKRSNKEQLERLDRAFGVGLGAKKERTRLQVS